MAKFDTTGVEIDFRGFDFPCEDFCDYEHLIVDLDWYIVSKCSSGVYEILKSDLKNKLNCYGTSSVIGGDESDDEDDSLGSGSGNYY